MGYAAQSAQGVWTSFTPTLTGFSVQPTGVTAESCRLGQKTFGFKWNMTGSGTSNATTFTLSMPFIAKVRCIYSVLVQNNGAYETQQAYVDAGSNIISFYRGAAAFTASGGKSAWGCIVVEEQ